MPSAGGESLQTEEGSNQTAYGALVTSSRRGRKEQWGYVFPNYCLLGHVIWKSLGWPTHPSLPGTVLVLELKFPHSRRPLCSE